MEMVHLTATDMTWQRFEVCNPNQKLLLRIYAGRYLIRTFLAERRIFIQIRIIPELKSNLFIIKKPRRGLASSQSILPQQIMIK